MSDEQGKAGAVGAAQATPGIAAVSRVFPAKPEFVSQARRFVAGVLQDVPQFAHATDAVVLLTSELVTNVILHTDSRVVGVRVEAVGRCLRITIADWGSKSKTVEIGVKEAAEDEEDGRGLSLVETIAARWGTRRGSERGLAIWFELAAA